MNGPHPSNLIASQPTEVSAMPRPIPAHRARRRCPPRATAHPAAAPLSARLRPPAACPRAGRRTRVQPSARRNASRNRNGSTGNTGERGEAGQGNIGADLDGGQSKSIERDAVRVAVLPRIPGSELTTDEDLLEHLPGTFGEAIEKQGQGEARHTRARYRNEENCPGTAAILPATRSAPRRRSGCDRVRADDHRPCAESQDGERC